MNFVRFKDVNNSYWQKAWSIYQKSFPVFERRKIENQIEAMNNDKFCCNVIVDDHTVIGLIFYWQWDQYIYIEHFAIDSNLRGKNYGSRIIEEFCKNDKVIILEIDPPVDDISIRRLNFYRKLGFQLNNHTHVNLPYRKDYQGYKLKILSYNCMLSEEKYKFFNDFLLNEIMQYCESNPYKKNYILETYNDNIIDTCS